MSDEYRVTRTAVTCGGRPVARIRYSGRMATVIRPDGRRAGRVMPAGYLRGHVSEDGLYDAWTARHSMVHTPSDRVLQENLTWADAVRRVLSGDEPEREAAVSEPGKIPFSDVDWRKGEWACYVDGRPVPLRDLVGKVVNIGTKDGLVYDSVQVTALAERTGYLTVEGGRKGGAYGGEVTGLAAPEDIIAWDIARGYIHPGAPS